MTRRTRMQTYLSRFDLPEMLRTGREIRSLSNGAATFEEAVQRMCHALYTGLCDDDGDPACVLVRCYKTHPFRELPASLQQFAKASALATGVGPETKCLVLLGSAGDESEWNSRLSSRHHRAIPLASADVVQQAPMIARLFKDLGVELRHLLAAQEDSVRQVRTKTYGVFHIESALGSPAIPAQADFVVRYGVQSVVGCGGELPRGEMFATILFSRVPVTESVADRFRALALDMKASFFRFGPDETFQTTQ
ncbi:MAG TPA: hypothetical protein VH277_12380 [Gemmatimonadaceae bacterium]|nr:hypothetical protein [Gemmatimonadaceae bacterium]